MKRWEYFSYCLYRGCHWRWSWHQRCEIHATRYRQGCYWIWCRNTYGWTLRKQCRPRVWHDVDYADDGTDFSQLEIPIRDRDKGKLRPEEKSHGCMKKASKYQLFQIDDVVFLKRKQTPVEKDIEKNPIEFDGIIYWQSCLVQACRYSTLSIGKKSIKFI